MCKQWHSWRTGGVFGAFLPVLFVIFPALGQQNSSTPYRIDFDSARDVTMQDRDAKTGKEGLYVTVRFMITVEGSSSEPLGNDYKIVIEEDGHRVGEEDVPRPTPSEELS